MLFVLNLQRVPQKINHFFVPSFSVSLSIPGQNKRDWFSEIAYIDLLAKVIWAWNGQFPLINAPKQIQQINCLFSGSGQAKASQMKINRLRTLHPPKGSNKNLRNIVNWTSVVSSNGCESIKHLPDKLVVSSLALNLFAIIWKWGYVS